jgi:DNA-binding transcriptional LysR family regulator
MDLRHLEVFNAVMKTGTTVGAAHLLCSSQPSVSNTIRHLEDMLGFDLFDRVKGRLIATEEAKMLFSEAQAVFAAFANTRRMVEEIQNNRSGSLTVAATPTVGNSILPGAIASFIQPRPDIKILVEIEHLDNVVRMVDCGAADLGLAINAFSLPTLVIQPIVTAHMVCVLANTHPLAARNVISPKCAANYPLISFSRDTILGRHIEAAFLKEGAGRNINIEVRYCETACVLAQSGVGIAIVDPFVLMGDMVFPNLVVRSFEPRIEAKACLIRSKVRRTSRIAQRFASVLTRHINLKHASVIPPPAGNSFRALREPRQSERGSELATTVPAEVSGTRASRRAPNLA